MDDLKARGGHWISSGTTDWGLDFSNPPREYGFSDNGTGKLRFYDAPGFYDDHFGAELSIDLQFAVIVYPVDLSSPPVIKTFDIDWNN